MFLIPMDPLTPEEYDAIFGEENKSESIAYEIREFKKSILCAYNLLLAKIKAIQATLIISPAIRKLRKSIYGLILSKRNTIDPSEIKRRIDTVRAHQYNALAQYKMLLGLIDRHGIYVVKRIIVLEDMLRKAESQEDVLEIQSGLDFMHTHLSSNFARFEKELKKVKELRALNTRIGSAIDELQFRIRQKQGPPQYYD